jgi:hypothetical protein
MSSKSHSPASILKSRPALLDPGHLASRAAIDIALDIACAEQSGVNS